MRRPLDQFAAERLARLPSHRTRVFPCSAIYVGRHRKHPMSTEGEGRQRAFCELPGWGDSASPPPGSRLTTLQKPTLRVGVLMTRTAVEGRLCLPPPGGGGRMLRAYCAPTNRVLCHAA